MILSPPLLAQVATVAAAAAYGLAWCWPGDPVEPGDNASASARGHRALLGLLTTGWLLHALVLLLGAIDWQASPLAARFGFALALGVTVWVVLGVYAFERVEPGTRSARRWLAALALLSLVLMQAFPGQRHGGAHAALAPLHWVLGLASYGLFGAALLHAGFWQIAERRLRHKASTPRLAHAGGIPLLTLESLTMRFVMAGFVVLTATLLLGAVFAQPWRWDHKSVFSVAAWLVFAVLLVGQRWQGWRGRQAIRWLQAGSLLLLLGYVGSRFVLEVLLQRPAMIP